MMSFVQAGFAPWDGEPMGFPPLSLGAFGKEVTADAWLPGLGLCQSQLTRSEMSPSFR